jgi:hypothetical protein
MSGATEAQIAAALVGILVTVAWRLIDRYLPDPNQQPPPRDRPNAARAGDLPRDEGKGHVL